MVYPHSTRGPYLAPYPGGSRLQPQERIEDRLPAYWVSESRVPPSVPTPALSDQPLPARTYLDPFGSGVPELPRSSPYPSVYLTGYVSGAPPPRDSRGVSSDISVSEHSSLPDFPHHSPSGPPDTSPETCWRPLGPSVTSRRLVLSLREPHPHPSVRRILCRPETFQSGTPGKHRDRDPREVPSVRLLYLTPHGRQYPPGGDPRPSFSKLGSLRLTPGSVRVWGHVPPPQPLRRPSRESHVSRSVTAPVSDSHSLPLRSRRLPSGWEGLPDLCPARLVTGRSVTSTGRDCRTSVQWDLSQVAVPPALPLVSSTRQSRCTSFPCRSVRIVSHSAYQSSRAN